MTSDDLYSYATRLRNAERLIKEDKTIGGVDRKIIFSFLAHIKGKEISVGRQAKCAFMLMRCAQLIRTPFAKARRRDFEDLMVKLGDFEFTSKKYGPVKPYTPATMSDFRLTIKVFIEFVMEDNTDKETPYPRIGSLVEEGDQA